METIYVHLNARKIRTGTLASGGAYEETGEYYALIPRRTAPAGDRPAGKVLDFEAYRHRQPRSAPPEPEWEAPETEPDDHGAAEPAQAGDRSERRARRWGLALDTCATFAILAMTAAACVRFLLL